MPMAPEKQSVWIKVRNGIAVVTGLLVGVGALINAGIDVYNTIMKIPRTAAEQTNVQLYQKYFAKQPVATVPIPVKRAGALYEARFSVYEEGDIFVEYGATTQWFPFPESRRIAKSGPFLISEAVAQEYSQTTGSYQQSEAFEKDLLIRERQYDSGALQRQVIDTRSGQILEQTIQVPAESTGPPAPVSVQPFAVIDLDVPVAVESPTATTQAAICITPVGSCNLVQTISMGAPCFCTTPDGPVEGQSH